MEGDSKHEHYKYGGTWKNKHEYVSGKIKGKAKIENKELWNGTPGPHGRSRRVKKRKRDLGDVKIGDDDGASDIEVSELSDWSEVDEQEIQEEINKATETEKLK